MSKKEFTLPITILSENEIGQLGEEYHEAMTRSEVIARCKEMSAKGEWEPIEIQGGEDMHTLDINWSKE